MSSIPYFPPQESYEGAKRIYMRYIMDEFPDEPDALKLAEMLPADHQYQATLRREILSRFKGSKIAYIFRDLTLTPKHPCSICCTYHQHYTIAIRGKQHGVCSACLHQHFEIHDDGTIRLVSDVEFTD